MRKSFFCLLAIFSLLFHSESFAATTPTPVGKWKLATSTKVQVLPLSSNKPAKTGNILKGTEFLVFNQDFSTVSSQWINRVKLYFTNSTQAYLNRLDIVGNWTIKSGAYTIHYDPFLLGQLDPSNNNTSINDAYLTRSGYLGLLSSTLKYTPTIMETRILSYSDKGKLAGKKITGAQNVIFLAYWEDPDTGDVDVAEVFVDTTYTGTPLPSSLNSDCCSTDTSKTAQNDTDSLAYLNANKTQTGVQTTASGLQYTVLQGNVCPTPGDASCPKSTDTVMTNYRGFLPSGTIFDSGSLISFGVGGVIKGWTEGLQLMTVGSKFRFYIPSALAYGSAGNAPNIGPNAVLIFDVELVSIN
jgi:FKBP-type peptidyl-prolyl cis-trans isomerase